MSDKRDNVIVGPQVSEEFKLRIKDFLDSPEPGSLDFEDLKGYTELDLPDQMNYVMEELGVDISNMDHSGNYFDAEKERLSLIYPTNRKAVYFQMWIVNQGNNEGISCEIIRLNEREEENMQHPNPIYCN